MVAAPLVDTGATTTIHHVAAHRASAIAAVEAKVAVLVAVGEGALVPVIGARVAVTAPSELGVTCGTGVS